MAAEGNKKSLPQKVERLIKEEREAEALDLIQQTSKWQHHKAWIDETALQEAGRKSANKTAYTTWRKAREKPTDYPTDFNRFKRNIGSFGDGRNQSVRIAHAKMVESEQKVNKKANIEPPIDEGITWVDVRNALLTTKEFRERGRRPETKVVIMKGTDKVVAQPKISPVVKPPPKEPKIATKTELEELTPEGLELPSAKKKKGKGRPPKVKEWTIASSATAQVFNKMLEASANLGDKYICLSSYNVGEKIIEGNKELNITGVLELSQNLLQFKNKKSKELNSFLNALAQKVPKSQIMEGLVEIATNGDIQTIEFDPKIAETYFDLKDLTSQLKKVQTLQEICEHYSDLQTKEGSLKKENLLKEKEMLEGLNITKPTDLLKLKKKHEEALKTAQAQIDSTEEQLKKIQAEAKEARKIIKTEAEKSKDIESRALFKEVENEWILLSPEKLSEIQSAMNKKITNIAKDDKDREGKIQVAIDNAYGEIKALAPNITALAEKDKTLWKVWDNPKIEPEEKQHIRVGKITGGKAKKEGLLTNFTMNKSRADKFFKEYKGEDHQFKSEMQEAILSPHSGIEKIVEPVKKIKDKKKKQEQDKVARRKLKSVGDIVAKLRKDMGLDVLNANADTNLTKFATNVKTLAQAKDFNTTQIPRQTMSQLIDEQYRAMKK